MHRIPHPVYLWEFCIFAPLYISKIMPTLALFHFVGLLPSFIKIENSTKNSQKIWFLRNIRQPLRKIYFLNQKVVGYQTENWRLIPDARSHHECAREHFILLIRFIIVIFHLEYKHLKSPPFSNCSLSDTFLII